MGIVFFFLKDLFAKQTALLRWRSCPSRFSCYYTISHVLKCMSVIPAQDALCLGYSTQLDCGRGVTSVRLFASLAGTLGCPWMDAGRTFPWLGARPGSGAMEAPSCFSVEMAASCPARSSGGAPGVAALFAFPFQAFCLGLLPCL